MDFCEIVLSNIKVSYILENLFWEFSAFVSLSMNEMTKVASCASGRSVVISARNGSIISGLNYLVWIRGWISSQLRFFEFVLLLEIPNSIISELH